MPQISGRVPDFVKEEWDQLRTDLRQLGCKPTNDDLVATLIHAASQAVEETKSRVEDYVKYELEKDREGG
jgi:hypothetical protein